MILVYEDCSFEVMDGAEILVETNEDEVNTLTHQLLEEIFCEDLTIKQIKILSRLIIISKNSTQRVEFVFDSEPLEKAYLASNSKPLSL